jgi:hypothetical protein
MTAPRMLYEVIAEACHESEQHTKKELRKTVTYRITIAGRVDQLQIFADSCLHGRFSKLLRIKSMKRLRKANSREREGWVEIEEFGG